MWCKGCWLRHKTEWWMWCKGCWLRHNAECDVMKGMLIKTQDRMVNVM